MAKKNCIWWILSIVAVFLYTVALSGLGIIVTKDNVGIILINMFIIAPVMAFVIGITGGYKKIRPDIIALCNVVLGLIAAYVLFDYVTSVYIGIQVIVLYIGHLIGYIATVISEKAADKHIKIKEEHHEKGSRKIAINIAVDVFVAVAFAFLFSCNIIPAIEDNFDKNLFQKYVKENDVKVGKQSNEKIDLNQYVKLKDFEETIYYSSQPILEYDDRTYCLIGILNETGNLTEQVGTSEDKLNVYGIKGVAQEYYVAANAQTSDEYALYVENTSAPREIEDLDSLLEKLGFYQYKDSVGYLKVAYTEYGLFDEKIKSHYFTTEDFVSKLAGMECKTYTGNERTYNKNVAVYLYNPALEKTYVMDFRKADNEKVHIHFRDFSDYPIEVIFETDKTEVYDFFNDIVK